MIEAHGHRIGETKKELAAINATLSAHAKQLDDHIAHNDELFKNLFGRLGHVEREAEVANAHATQRMNILLEVKETQKQIQREQRDQREEMNEHMREEESKRNRTMMATIKLLVAAIISLILYIWALQVGVPG